MQQLRLLTSCRAASVRAETRRCTVVTVKRIGSTARIKRVSVQVSGVSAYCLATEVTDRRLMEEHVGSMSPTCLLSRFEAHASTAVTPERCSCPLSDAFCVSESGAVLDASFSSAAKTVRRLPSSWTYTRDVEQLQGSVQQSQQQDENIQIRPQSPVECHAVAEASVKAGLEGAAGELLKDHIEECIDHMMRCESLEKRLLCVESENKELRSRLSECSVLHERQYQETKAEYEDDTKRLRSVIQALKIDILQLQTASQEMVQNSRVKDELLKTAQQECRNLQSKLNAFASDLQPCSKVKVASEVAAAEERAALAVQAAEARAIQTKVSAAAEIQRCRSETERLVTELGEAKATINDYMWRCEAMQCSLINARHGLTSASEATAAAERRALADLEAANYRAQEAQAAFEAEIREWREEVARLREALAESNATVDKFIDHSCSLQEELELSQAESLNLFYYSLLRSRSGT